MATAWDKHSASSLTKLQNRLVAEQVAHAVGPFSPYWKKRFGELGRTPGSVKSVDTLATLPAVGERDISPSGDPAGLAALVLQATEGGFALHASGPTVRRALRLRMSQRDAYREFVELDTKPTSYVWAGLAFRYPVASTRSDLDVIARAGARMWQVAGLTAHDALLSTLPVESSTEHMALHYAAMAAGAPALFPGNAADDIAVAARLAPPTVVAAPASAAQEVLSTLAAGGLLSRLRTVLLVGAPSDDERNAAQAVVGGGATVLAVHAPAGARVLWAECRQGGASAGLHTYPDLDVVQLVDPETGEATVDGGEIVLTQLGMRGSALLRWRTGDLAAGRVDVSRCPGCQRQVPRLTGVRRGALVLVSDDGRTLDLRTLAGAMAGRADVSDWRIVVGRRQRDGRGQVVVHLVPTGEAAETSVAAAADIRSLSGLLPTQIVAAERLEDIDGGATPLTRRIHLRR